MTAQMAMMVRLNYSCGKKEPRGFVVFPNFLTRRNGAYRII